MYGRVLALSGVVPMKSNKYYLKCKSWHSFKESDGFSHDVNDILMARLIRSLSLDIDLHVLTL